MFRSNAIACALALGCAVLSAAPARAGEFEPRTFSAAPPASAASQGANVAAAVTQALPLVVPDSFDGDIRDLPDIMELRSYLALLNEFDEPEPHLPPVQGADRPAPYVPLAPMPGPVANFRGLGLSDQVSGGQAGGGYPPDVNGDVGTTYYIQSVNMAFAVYNKATGAQVAAFTENQLWSASTTATPCKANNFGDPVVVHDALADRWILTDFAFSVSGGVPQQPYYECMAVSKTSDPLAGGWWFYAIKFDTGAAGQPPLTIFGDYPKFGEDGNCLYLGANGFNEAFNPAQYGGAIFASFQRNALFTGAALDGTNSSLGYLAADGNSDPFSLFPANALGNSVGSMPPANTPEWFVSQSTTQYAFEVRPFTPGNGCGAGGVLGAAVLVPSPVWQQSSSGSQFVPQPGTTNKLDTLEARLMQRVSYRKIGATESLWVTETVGNGTTVPAQPMWAQINVSGGQVAAAATQSGIYAPDNTKHRFLGSLAVDSVGNMAIGYSTANGAAPNYPSLAYSGRLATDTLGQLPQTETQLVAGGGSQANVCGSGPCQRWGDYFSMTMDPTDDCTFWFSGEYYDTIANGNAGNWQTRIGSFKFPNCNAAAATHTVTPSVTGGGTISPNTAQTVNNGFTTSFTLTPTAGAQITNVTGTCGGILSGVTFTTNAITADCTVIANFTGGTTTHTVTPSVTGSGSISPNGAQTVNDGATTTFSVTPAAGNHLVNVTGTCGGSLSGNTYTTNAITANCTVVANFAATQHTVTPSVTGNGSISPNKAQTINDGAVTMFTLTPNAGNRLVDVTGTCGGTLSGTTFTTSAVTADCTVVANFAVATHTITPSVSGNGAISPSSAQTVNDGTTAVFTLTPNAGNHLVDVTGTCGGTLSNNAFTTNAVSANCTVVANFAVSTHTVTAGVTGNGSISPSGAQTLNDGASATFTLTPAAGNHVANVSGSCGGSLSGNTYTTNAVEADCDVVANFAADVLVFTTQPADVTRGGAMANVVLQEQDGSGRTMPVNGSVDFTISACGALLDLGTVSMTNGVATLQSDQRFYTLGSGLSIAASTGSLNATSTTFSVVANPDLVFSESFEGCRL